MFDVRLLMFEGTLPRSACAPGRSTIKHQTSNIHPTSVRPGMSLIELLVVIVILTTLVAGVIPILSPNNDARKIRTAAQNLQSYFMLAQAQAASTGRPHGIAFRESSAGSGVALEVFSLEVPVPFAGFASASAARLIREKLPTTPPTYNYYVQFFLADSPTGNSLDSFAPKDYDFDPVPPNFVRFNDEVVLSGKRFQFIDEDLDGDGTNDNPKPEPGDFYTLNNSSNSDHNSSTYKCKIETNISQTFPFVKFYEVVGGGSTTYYSMTAPKPYQIIRQPTNSIEAPYQIPSGIAVDLQASGVDGSTSGFPISGSFDTRNHNKFNSNEPITDTVGIMFSPNGSISSVIHNGNTVPGVSRIAILLGRVENGNLQYTPSGAADFDDVTEGAWQPDGASADAIDEKQQQVNWLNLDSRWLMISVRDGRMVVSENAFVNPNDYSGTPVEQAGGQIEAALEFAREMK